MEYTLVVTAFLLQTLSRKIHKKKYRHLIMCIERIKSDEPTIRLDTVPIEHIGSKVKVNKSTYASFKHYIIISMTYLNCFELK